MSLLITGSLTPEELQSVKQETNHFFEQHTFEKSTVVIPRNSYSENRTSSTFFPDKSHVRKSIDIIWKRLRTVYTEELYPNLHDNKVVPQLIKYDPGQFFFWHKDNVKGNRIARVITASINLSDYEGGGLFVKYHNKIEPIKNDIGSFGIFPANCWHCAKAPTSGQRRVMTFWFHGKLPDIETNELLYKEEKCN